LQSEEAFFSGLQEVKGLTKHLLYGTLLSVTTRAFISQEGTAENWNFM
jgi:hypothetical protein